jgi:hypothetical protein
MIVKRKAIDDKEKSMNIRNLPEPPVDMDSSGDFINESTAPQLFEEEDDCCDDYDPTEAWLDAFMTSAEFRAMVM